MPYRHITADDERHAALGIFTVVRNVQHGTVLDIGTLTDFDAVHIPAHHTHRPDRTVFADADLPDNQSLLIDSASPAGRCADINPDKQCHRLMKL